MYGQPDKIPCLEDYELKAMNPYGRTKVCPRRYYFKIVSFHFIFFVVFLVKKIVRDNVLFLNLDITSCFSKKSLGTFKRPTQNGE